MKTIIMTILPIHLGNIRRGIKTVELRKTKPKCDTPFRVLLCESGSGGQIKAEFTCSEIAQISPVDAANYNLIMESCLSESEIRHYLYGQLGYAWRIENMIDYCSTKGRRIKNIKEFGLSRPPQSWQYAKEVCDDG